MRGKGKSIHVGGTPVERDKVHDDPNMYHAAADAPDGGWDGFDKHDAEIKSLHGTSLSKSEFAGHKGLGIER
jgi:hypothetical protein